jgi:hypothetical protein
MIKERDMNTDLIGSIELTASAAIVIAALSIGFGSNAAARVRIALSLSSWFVVVVILAATRALYYEHGLGSPGLGIAVALPIVILCIVVSRATSLREGFHRVPLWLLVGVHAVRLLGISFIILYAAGRLPRAVRSGCWLGRYFCWSNRLPGCMARVSTTGKRSADIMDLEYHRISGFDRRNRIGSNFLARSGTPDLRRT